VSTGIKGGFSKMATKEYANDEVEEILKGFAVSSTRFNELIKEFAPQDLITAFLKGKVTFDEENRWEDNAREQLSEILNQKAVREENIRLAWYLLLSQLEDGSQVFYWREPLEALLDHYNCPNDIVKDFANDFLIDLTFEDKPWWEDINGTEAYEMEDYLDNLFNACMNKVDDEEIKEKLEETYDKIVEYRLENS